MYLRFILFYVSFFKLIYCDETVEIEDPEAEPELRTELKFDFNLYYNRLNKFGNRELLKNYLETPDSDIFINADSLGEKPSKLHNYTDYITNVFNKWDDRVFTENLLSCFTYVDKTEFINNEEIKSRTNFRHFVKGKKKNPTSVELPMPAYLKENLDTPSVLDCDYLRDQNLFESVDLQFHYNYKIFSPSKKSDFDQFFCMAKGNATIMMTNQTFVDRILSKRDNYTKGFFKKINFHMTDLIEGQCLFIPKEWTYALKTKSSLLIKISWNRVDKYIDDKLCFGAEGIRKNATKLSANKYLTDKENIQKNNELSHGIGIVVYFANYLFTSSKDGSFKRAQFEELVQKDEIILQSIKTCEETCIEFSQKLFNMLDQDKNKILNLDDFSVLDEEKVKRLNSRILEEVNKLPMISIDFNAIMDKLAKFLGDLNFNEITDSFRTKAQEWIDSLPDGEIKSIFKKLNLDQLLQTILNSNKIDQQTDNKPAKKGKKGKKAKKQKNQDDLEAEEIMKRIEAGEFDYLKEQNPPKQEL